MNWCYIAKSGSNLLHEACFVVLLMCECVCVRELHLMSSSFFQRNLNAVAGPPSTTTCWSLLVPQLVLWSWPWSLSSCWSTATIETKTESLRWSSMKKRKPTFFLRNWKRLIALTVMMTSRLRWFCKLLFKLFTDYDLFSEIKLPDALLFSKSFKCGVFLLQGGN